jgi:predicted acylesterase/phospholipase RssA
MGKVVKLQPSATERQPARRRRRRDSKTALVLGGGGFTGGVYEIGALRALDLLSVNRSINQFDIYVGTSAGAFIAAVAANGITPEEMMRTVIAQTPTPFRYLDAGTVLKLDVRELALRAAMLPLRAARVGLEMLGQLGEASLMDVAVGLAEALPPGFYSGSGIEEYVRRVLHDPDRSDDFRMLERELYIVATDLDTCERIVFGGEGWDDVPISTAVRASSALPMVYRPVEVRGREMIDGGIVSTTNLDIAVEAGAKLIVVVNPLVPFVNDFQRTVMTLRGARPRRISDMGFPQIGYQAFKLLAYQRLHEMARLWEQRYPGVDIVLIEPEANDELMFQTSMMNFNSRIAIARHGFQSVTLKLAEEYETLKEQFGRHGIEVSADRVRKVIRHFGAEPEKVSAWRKILEQTTGTLVRQSGDG